MKFHAFLLLTAGFTAATMLAACQKNAGGKAGVRDGRTNAAKAGKIEQKIEPVLITCSGSIIIDGVKKDVIPQIKWDQKTELAAPLLQEVDNTDEDNVFALELSLTKNGTPVLALAAELDKDKTIRSFGTLQSKVRLNVEHQGKKNVVMNVLCAGSDSEKQLAVPIKLNKEKMAELVCMGDITIGDEKTSISKQGSDVLLAAVSTAEGLKFEKLTMGKTIPELTLMASAKLSSDLRKGDVKITLSSTDAKLKITADSKNDLASLLVVTSMSEKSELLYRCVRKEIATGKTADEATALGLTETPVEDEVAATPADETEKTPATDPVAADSSLDDVSLIENK